MAGSIRISVPATSANLGPGFDALGLALELRNELEVIPEGARGELRLEIRGEGADTLPRDREHLAYRALCAVFLQEEQPVPGLRIVQHNRIPTARGLGSSAATIVAGAAAALALLELDPGARLLQIACELEGHPDNVAPAILGGLVASAMGPAGPLTARLPLCDRWHFALAIPDFEVTTAEARRRLPASIPMADVTFNLSRQALLLAAFQSGDGTNLPEALEDRLHQPFRAPLIPGFEQAVERGLGAGACGVFISGSGSTVAGLVHLDRADPLEVARAMAEAFGPGCRALALAPDFAGVVYG